MLCIWQVLAFVVDQLDRAMEDEPQVAGIATGQPSGDLQAPFHSAPAPLSARGLADSVDTLLAATYINSDIDGLRW